MKPQIYIISLIATLLCVSTANAGYYTAYSCCNTFVTDPGILLNGFENSSEWVKVSNSGVGGYLEVDTTNFIEGTQSIKMSTDNATKPLAMQWDMSTPISQSEVQNFQLWVKIDDRENTSDLGIYMSNTSSFSSYMAFEWEQISYRLDNGWHKISFSTADFNYYGGLQATDPINSIRFRNIPYAGKRSNITVDDFRINVTARPKIIINIDDGHGSVYTYAKPILKANNQPAILYAVTGKIGVDPIYMTTSQLKELEADGWDVGSHTVTHPSLVTNTTEELHTELGDSRSWLLNNGFNPKAARIISYPYGDYNDNVLSVVDNYYLLGRTTDYGKLQAQIDYSTDNVDDVLYTLPWFNVNNETAVSSVQDYINKTISRQGIGMITFHRFSTDVNPALSTEYNVTKFDEISNYLASRSSDVDVIRMSEFIIEDTVYYDNSQDFVNIFVPMFSGIFLIYIVLGLHPYGREMMNKYVGIFIGMILFLMLLGVIL